MANHRLAAFRRGDPGAVGPGRVVAHMLVVATGEFGDPVTGIVLVKADDFLLQEFKVPLEQDTAPVPSAAWTALTPTLAKLQPYAFAILARWLSSAPMFPGAAEG